MTSRIGLAAVSDNEEIRRLLAGLGDGGAGTPADPFALTCR